MLCLLNEIKYQSYVRVRVLFVPGFVSSSCPARVWVRVWLVSGFVSGSCLVCVWVRVELLACVWFVST